MAGEMETQNPGQPPFYYCLLLDKQCSASMFELRSRLMIKHLLDSLFHICYFFLSRTMYMKQYINIVRHGHGGPEVVGYLPVTR